MHRAISLAKSSRRHAATRVLAALLLATPAIAGGADSLDIAYTSDRLTGQASGVARARVVSEVCAKAGVEVVGAVVDPDEAISVEFGGDALEKEIGRLLQHQSYSLVYADTGKLREIQLHGRIAEAPIGVHPAQPPSPAAAPLVAARPPELPADLIQAVQDHPPIPLAEPLRSVVGTPSASIPTLYTVAAQNPSPAVRASALEAISRAVQADPRLRAALSSAGPSLQGFVAATGGESADRILGGLTTMQPNAPAPPPRP